MGAQPKQIRNKTNWTHLHSGDHFFTGKLLELLHGHAGETGGLVEHAAVDLRDLGHGIIPAAL